MNTNFIKKFKSAHYDKTPSQIVRHFFPSIGLKTSDVIISSFPKSGRNWVLFLIANAITQNRGIDIEINFQNIHQIIPHTLSSEPKIEGFPRMIASHKTYQKQKTRAIYVMRHPADVMVSYFYFLKNRRNKKLSDFSDFIKNKDKGIPAWKDHVKSWEGHWDVLVKYEDLKEDSLRELKRMLSLFNKEFKEENLNRAVDKSSFKQMSKVQQKAGLPYKKGSSQKFNFMRKGKHDKGQSLFQEEDYKYLNKITGNLLTKYNYECK